MSGRLSRWDTFAPPPPTTSSPRETRSSSISAPTTTPAPPRYSPRSDSEFPCLFFSPSAEIPQIERVSILNAMRRLPQQSITAQFARGECLRGLVEDAVWPQATVYKSWHQQPNMHFTVRLYWVDEFGNQVKGGSYGGAHVHVNGLEVLVEHHTGNKLVRQPNSTAWQIVPPVNPRPVAGDSAEDVERLISDLSFEPWIAK